MVHADVDASVAADAYAYYSTMKASTSDSASKWTRYKLRTAERRAQTTAAAAAASAAAVRVAKVSAQLRNNEYFSTQASLALEAAAAASDARSSAETRALREAEKASTLQAQVEKVKADIEIQMKISEDLKSAHAAAESDMKGQIQKLEASLMEAQKQASLFAESISALELGNAEANARALALQEQLERAMAANTAAPEPSSEAVEQKAEIDAKLTSEAVSRLEAEAASKVAKIEKSMRAWADKEVATVAARAAVELRDAQEALLAAETSTRAIEATKRALEVDLLAQMENGARLEMEVEEMKRTLAAFDAGAAQAASETVLGGRVQELEAALSAAQRQEKSLQSSLQKLESTSKDTSNQLVTLQKDFDAAVAATEAASKNSKELEAKVAVLQETVANQASALELASLTDSSNKEYRRQIAQLNAELEKARALAESRGDLLEQSFETLDIERRESEIALLQAQREQKAAEAEAAQATAKVENLQEKFDIAVEEIASLITQRDAAEEEVTSLAEQRNTAERDLSMLTAQNDLNDSATSVRVANIVSAVQRMRSQILTIAAAFFRAARNQGAMLKQLQEENTATSKTELLHRLSQRLPFMNTAGSSQVTDKTPKRPLLAWLSMLGVASLAIFLSIFEVSFAAV